MRPLRIVILGATGSIGSQALEVIDRYPTQFQVLGLVSGRRPPAHEARVRIQAGDPDFDARVEELVSHPECDLVLVAIPGALSLRPTLAALRARKKVALASKEVLVMAGELVMAAAGPDAIRPVDSEHSAIWQCLWGEHPESVGRLLLTATGGPFWARPEVDLAEVTVADALRHPRWAMGQKVSIDSATLMNKGLEVIEAHHLFGVALDRIDVVVHPQAVIHSLVQFVDGSAKAQLGNPDMRLPIGLALSYPERLPDAVPPTRFQDLGPLELHPLDDVRHPAVRLAREAGARGAPYPAVLNAANEEAVAAFLRGEVRFPAILDAVSAALGAWSGSSGPGLALEELVAADRAARDYVRSWLGKVRP
ncbi:MAG: 1-deoxy-D-xylulose-5-phosphate reductoisomerase [Candidatus Dormibacteraeota bacterium]|nr:1-deoxy-D-xylulose-5-phosphate reductoisomerase [Candidatus Dormibacteraeota bacterium]